VQEAEGQADRTARRAVPTIVNLMDALRRSVAQEKRASAQQKKGRKRIAGQIEMLLPIAGKKGKEVAAARGRATEESGLDPARADLAYLRNRITVENSTSRPRLCGPYLSLGRNAAGFFLPVGRGNRRKVWRRVSRTSGLARVPMKSKKA
jgi:hypothetical protein